MARDRSEPKALINSLVDTFAKMGLSDQAFFLQCVTLWPRVVGERIGENTRPSRLVRGTLTVETRHAAWQQELHYMKSSIITRLNNELGTERIKDLRFVSGPFLKEGETQAKPPELNEWGREQVAATVAAIDDDEVREQFAKAMGVFVAYQTEHEKKAGGK